MNCKMKLVLKDGRTFTGIGETSCNEAIGELVFNTSMVGYQEISTDPFYKNKIVVMTYPLIGNYGTNDSDYESKSVKISGLIVREYNDEPSNFRYTNTLKETLEEDNVSMISGLDTRMLTRIIRNEGSMLAMITSVETKTEDCIKKMEEYEETNLVSMVSTKKKWVSRCKNPRFNVVCLDLGTKRSLIQKFNEKNCNVYVLSYDATVDKIMELEPDGLFISNGPGCPCVLEDTINTVKALKGKLPIFGVGLGQVVLGMAYDAKAYKLKFAYCGGNHTAKNLLTNVNSVINYSVAYAVDKESIKKTKLEVTHIDNLNNEICGIRNDKDMSFAVLYIPDGDAAPADCDYLYNEFTKYMEIYKGGKSNA